MAETKMTMDDIRKRITYHQEGEFLVPEIGLAKNEESEIELRKYGMMRKKYLENHYLPLYEKMVMNGTLFQKMRKIDEIADQMREQMLTKMAKEMGVTEELKRTNQLEWVRKMEACNHQVEEIILKELVYS